VHIHALYFLCKYNVPAGAGACRRVKIVMCSLVGVSFERDQFRARGVLSLSSNDEYPAP
jgi:hypothetical protein